MPGGHSRSDLNAPSCPLTYPHTSLLSSAPNYRICSFLALSVACDLHHDTCLLLSDCREVFVAQRWCSPFLCECRFEPAFCITSTSAHYHGFQGHLIAIVEYMWRHLCLPMVLGKTIVCLRTRTFGRNRAVWGSGEEMPRRLIFITVGWTDVGEDTEQKETLQVFLRVVSTFSWEG